MSSDDLADFFVHTVSVQTYRGTAGSGAKLYDPPADVPCFLSRKLRLVRAANGDQVPSGSALSADITQADVLTPQSKVTIGAEPPTTIITVAISTADPFIEGIDRVKAYLQ